MSARQAAERLVARRPEAAPGEAEAPLGAVVGFHVGSERAVAAAGLATASRQGVDDEPMAVDLRFDVASVTKVLATTVSVASLVAANALSFDTPVRMLVPSFPGHDGTTVRHLLAHRAGLPSWQPLYLAPGVHDDPCAALDSIGPDAPLDSAFAYSDLGFLHLGRVVEAAAGEPLATAVHRLALVPLGIPGAGFRPAGVTADADGCSPSAVGDAAERTMVATGSPYPVRWSDQGFPWRTHLLRGEVNDGNCWHAFGGVTGHAGLFATVDELLTAARALGQSVVGDGPLPATVARALVDPGPDPQQALGLRRDGAWAWHPGFTGCAIGFVPGRPVAAAMATNRLLRGTTPVPTADLWHAATASISLRLAMQGVS